jgi:hypothetical protein
MDLESFQEAYLSQYLASPNIPQTQINLFDQKIPDNIKAFFQLNDLGAFEGKTFRFKIHSLKLPKNHLLFNLKNHIFKTI